jgi:sulfite oxidase
VDISVDGGKTWVEARRYQKDNVPYVSDGPQSDKWAWVLFEATLDIPANAEIVAKAVSETHCNPLFSATFAALHKTGCENASSGLQVDSAANVQPENVEDIWNLRGILNTSWHRIKIQNSSCVGRSKL